MTTRTPHSVFDAKIGYLVPEFPGQTHAFFWRELRAMEESGTRVAIFSTRRPGIADCPHDFAAAAQARTHYLFPPNWGRVLSTVLRHPLGAIGSIAYAAGLRQSGLVQRLKVIGLISSAADLVAQCRSEQIGHVHIHSCANAAHLGALANRLGGLKYSLTLHGDLDVYGTDHTSKMANARFVSAVTAPLCQSLRDLLGPQKRIPLIWMGVDTKRFCPRPDPPTVDVPFTAVTIARLNFTKGHRFFLRAIAALRDQGIIIHYKIAGEGNERAAISSEIEKLNLGEQVEMLGAIGEAAVLELLQSSDMLALTSIQKGEAAPVAVMEAMACGLPVVCSIIGGTPDMIRDGEDGFLVPQEDVETIVDRVRQLATDPKLLDRMGRAARQSAMKLFDHRTNAKALYQQISGHSK